VPIIDVEIFTDDTDLQRLCRAYWQQNADGTFVHRVADLELPPGVQRPQIAATVREHARATSSEVQCVTCGQPREFRSRAEATTKQRWTQERCFKCLEREEQELQRRRHELAELRTRTLLDSFHRPQTPCAPQPVALLSLRHATLLLALIRVGADDQMETVRPAKSWTTALTPRRAWDLEVLTELFNSGLLQISETSSPDAFDWIDDVPERFRGDEVRWCVATLAGRHDLPSTAAALRQLIEDRDVWPAAWHLELEDLWRDITEKEVLAYLAVQVEAHHLPLTVGPRLRHVVSHALSELRPGQLFNLSWRAARDAAAFYQRERVTRQHAANTVAVRIESAAERALAEGYAAGMKSFRRDRAAPESAWSSVLADRVYAVGSALLEMRAFDVQEKSGPAGATVTRLAERFDVAKEEVARQLVGVPLTLEAIAALVASGKPEALERLAFFLGLPNPVKSVPGPPSQRANGPAGSKSRRRSKKSSKKKRRR
jgi:hypothetical protein